MYNLLKLSHICSYLFQIQNLESSEKRNKQNYSFNKQAIPWFTGQYKNVAETQSQIKGASILLGEKKKVEN